MKLGLRSKYILTPSLRFSHLLFQMDNHPSCLLSSEDGSGHKPLLP